MGWIGERIKGFRQVPDPYFSLAITGRFLLGVGIGLLLANWLPLWTCWIFIGVGIVIGIPGRLTAFKGKT